MANVAVEKCRESGKFPEALSAKMSAIIEDIRRRAFDLFEGRGGTIGQDLDDWLQAEQDVVWSPASELIENKSDFQLRIAVPGFDPKDLEVTATPNALVIQGEAAHTGESKEGSKVCFSEFSDQQMFRRIDLPSEIDVDKVTASMDKGILEVTAPKAASKQLKVAA